LIEITRRQKIMEQLFSFLLEKKIEMSIGSASTIPSSRIIESAASSGIPVKPQKGRSYVFALLLGMLAPGVLIFLKEYLNDKIRSRADIEHVTQAPILGEVSHSQEKQDLVVHRDSRTFIAEQFRMIRSNMQYVMPRQGATSIMVTSSLSGEGKSYISLNVAAALALTGKRTVILEFDMRKPSILSKLGMPKRSGLSNFIIGNAPYEGLAEKVEGWDNLFVISSGPTPPNPSELLLDDKCRQLFEMLKKDFDIIIIDTAPVGLVSDATTLATHADACVYVLRHNYTQRKQLKLVEDIYRSKKLPNLALVINDIDLRSGTYDYYGYSSYGGGYGSSYGYLDGYYDGPVPGRRWYQKFLKRFFS
jgi:tyrosine-protein kinase Etk/Wzc